MTEPAKMGAAELVAGPLAAPEQFSFFRLAQLLERFFGDAPPLGAADGAALERVRFRALDSLAFPAADIAGAASRPRRDGEPDLLELTVTFLGLYGPASPLPAFYTERVLHDDLDGTLRTFYDFFNHRLIALLYRCWLQYRHYLRFRPDGTDSISRAVFALAGLRPSEGSGGIRWVRLLGHAGLLGFQACPPSVLARVVGHYLGVPVRVEEGIERRVAVPPEQRTRLGLGACTLGADLVLGEDVPDLSGKFRLWVGPVGRPEFDGLFLDPVRNGELFRLVRRVVRDGLEFDVRVLVDEAELTPWHLGGPRAAPLGQLAWLGSTAQASAGVGLQPAAC